MHVCTCVHAYYVCMYIMYVCMYVCMHVRMYVCMHACIHTCMTAENANDDAVIIYQLLCVSEGLSLIPSTLISCLY